MNKLIQLISECKAMDIINQILAFGNATLPNEAEAELESLLDKNARLRQLIIDLSALNKRASAENRQLWYDGGIYDNRIKEILNG